MPDDFALWKAAKDAKKAAKAKREDADRLKKIRNDAWDEYTLAYADWEKWAKGQDHNDRQNWIDCLEDHRKRWDKAERDWEAARDAATKAERDAIDAVDAFNRALPPGVPMMPMPDEY